MRFILEIENSNAAFRRGHSGRGRSTSPGSRRPSRGRGPTGLLRDLNGNHCGAWQFGEGDEDEDDDKDDEKDEDKDEDRD